MTPQEQDMIDGLVDRIRKTELANKDIAAEQRLQQGLAGYPDALYVLAQTVLVQQYGLTQAQGQISDLQAQVDTLQGQIQQAQEHARSSGAGGGFLSHIFGGGASSQPAPQQPPPSYQPVSNPGYGGQPYPGGYPPLQQPYPPQGYPGQAPGMFGGGGGGGFLQSAMQTAAGVAAGEMMFQGMESLFHGFEHGGGSGLAGMGDRGGESVVNNYYDDDRGKDDDRGSGSRDAEDRSFGDQGRDDGSFYNPSDDASRTSGGEAQFADTGDTTQDSVGNDGGGFDDGGSDNSDSSGFDDNSSGDDGSGGF